MRFLILYIFIHVIFQTTQAMGFVLGSFECLIFRCEQ